MVDVPRDLMVALRFIRVSREDPSLRKRIQGLDPALGLPPVVDVAVDAGYVVDVESLRAAHLYDWILRRARYSVGSESQAEAAHSVGSESQAEAADSVASTVAVVNNASSST